MLLVVCHTRPTRFFLALYAADEYVLEYCTRKARTCSAFRVGGDSQHSDD